MKYMVTILTVLLIYHSTIPCADVKGADNCDTEMQFHAQNNEDNGGHSDTDGCSPFCVCQCCQTPIVFSTYFAGTSVIVFNPHHKGDYYQRFHANGMIYAIWHPPKFA